MEKTSENTRKSEKTQISHWFISALINHFYNCKLFNHKIYT